MRPSQWTKNGFVLAAPIFSLHFFELGDFLRAIWAFGVFCLLTSGVYVWNDVVDRERDRGHPEKRDRPIASGRLSPRLATATALAFLSLSLGAGFSLNAGFGVVCLAYVVNNLLYTHWIKQLVILDVMSIGAGFVLRAIAGGEAVRVGISNWLILCSFLLALFLGFCKRRHEIGLLKESSRSHRLTLGEYSAPFLDMMIAVVTGSTVLSYALYTVSDETVLKFGTENLIYTTLFVIYGIFRYLYLVYCRFEGGNPTRLLLDDHPLQLTILLWLFVSTWIIYR